MVVHVDSRSGLLVSLTDGTEKLIQQEFIKIIWGYDSCLGGRVGIEKGLWDFCLCMGIILDFPGIDLALSHFDVIDLMTLRCHRSPEERTRREWLILIFLQPFQNHIVFPHWRGPYKISAFPENRRRSNSDSNALLIYFMWLPLNDFSVVNLKYNRILGLQAKNPLKVVPATYFLTTNHTKRHENL